MLGEHWRLMLMGEYWRLMLMGDGKALGISIWVWKAFEAGGGEKRVVEVFMRDLCMRSL